MNNKKPKTKIKGWGSGEKVQDYLHKLQLDSKSKDGKVFEDPKNRRVVPKELLYADIDLDYEEENDDSNPTPQSWTDQSWRKADTIQESSTSSGKLKLIAPKSKLAKTFNAAAAKPVESDKAASMMMKMGWKGGALGKTGDGITEPIVPNIVYATKTIGFGALTETTKKQRKQPPKKRKQKLPTKSKKKLQKEVLTNNVLRVVLEFVRNTREIQILFDPQLYKIERKMIHEIINGLINNDEDNTMSCDTEQQVNLLEEICEYNNYILKTESEGITPNRTLCLFKEAPSYVYLVTPDDLRAFNHDEVDENDEYGDFEQIDDESELYTNDENSEIANNDKNKTSVETKVADNDNEITKNENNSHSNSKSNIKVSKSNLEMKQNDEKMDVDATHNIKEPKLNIPDNVQNFFLLMRNQHQEKCNKMDTNEITVNNNKTIMKSDDTKSVSVAKMEVSNTISNVDSQNKLLNAIIKVSTENIQDEDNVVDLSNEEDKTVDKNKDIIDTVVDSSKEDEKANENKDIIDNVVDLCKEEDKISNENKDIINNVVDLTKEDKIADENKNLSNTKNDKLDKTKDIIDTLIDYFTEYLEDETYTEFRFLGPFNDEEIVKINEFIATLHFSVNRWIDLDDDRYKEVITSMDKAKCDIDITTDVNEGIVIYKIPKS